VVVDETFLTKNIDAAALAEQAYKLRPSFLAFRESVELNKADYLSAWGASLPGLYYIYSKQHNEYDPASLMTTAGDTETWTLSAKWNFFAGGANWFQIHEKANNRDKYREQEKIQRGYILIEIQSALDDLRAQIQNVLAAREQNQLAAESLRIARINFESGNGTSTQLNDALIQRQSSGTNLIRALYDYEYARAKLNYAAGQEIF
jgi:outer membrane protein TolC